MNNWGLYNIELNSFNLYKYIVIKPIITYVFYKRIYNPYTDCLSLIVQLNSWNSNCIDENTSPFLLTSRTLLAGQPQDHLNIEQIALQRPRKFVRIFLLIVYFFYYWLSWTACAESQSQRVWDVDTELIPPYNHTQKSWTKFN